MPIALEMYELLQFTFQYPTELVLQNCKITTSQGTETGLPADQIHADSQPPSVRGVIESF